MDRKVQQHERDGLLLKACTRMMPVVNHTALDRCDMRVGRIEMVERDITTLSVDAIVNAANTSLLGGGGVGAAICFGNEAFQCYQRVVQESQG